MSVQAMAWALVYAPVTDPTALAVLVNLANNADESGRGAYPSQALLADRSRVSERSVRRWLADLEESGLIRRGDQRMVLHYPPDRRPVVWDLAMELRRKTGGTPVTARSGVAAHRGDTGDQTGGPPAADKPSINTNHPSRALGAPTTQKENSSRGHRIPDGWSLTEHDLAYATTHGLSRADAYHEAEKFLNYWQAAAGPNAVKRDWSAAWRNWVLKCEEQGPQSTAPRSGPRPTDDVWQIYERDDEEYKREQWRMSHPNGKPYPGDPDKRVRDADGKLIWATE